MEVWAQALHALNHADENTDLSLVLDVMQGNTTIPVIVLNDKGGIDDYRNIQDTLHLDQIAQRMLKAGDTIVVGSQIVCYDESVLLKRLSQYPYWQLGVVMIFVWLPSLPYSHLRRLNRIRFGLDYLKKRLISWVRLSPV
jgi:hypothetical protein